MAKLDDYFARELDIADLEEKIEDYYKALQSLGYISKINRCYAQYYGQGATGVTDRITPGGDQGELSKISINDFRSLLRHQFTLVTSDRPAFDVRAINTDSKSQKQAILGEDVLDYYMRGHRMEEVLMDATEKALYSSEGWVEIYWDASAGNPHGVDPETGEMVNTGDVAFRTYDCLDAIKDIKQSEGTDWVILKQMQNKYDLAARYSEHEAFILDLNTAESEITHMTTNSTHNPDETDMIYVYRLYHKRMPITPGGVHALFIKGMILEEGTLPLLSSSSLPVFRIMPAKLQDYGLGYTQAFDIIGIQEVTDTLYEAVISNNINFSKQNILVHKDADLHVRDLGGGYNMLGWDGDVEPKALQLTKSAPETYSLIENLDSKKESFTGINEVVRGDPSANLRSGNALALVAAQAIKFNSTLQGYYHKLIEDCGMGILDYLKEFAPESEMFINIVGKHNKSYLKAFKGSDLAGVSRVQVQSASALSKTTAGKVELANNLLQNKQVDGQGYLNVVETGKLDVIIEDKISEELNVKQENEWLQDGKKPKVLIFDNHPMHIKKHKAIIDDPEVRQNPEEIQNVLDHIQDHLDQWFRLDPNVAMALGIQPPQAPPAPPGQEGGAPAGAPPVDPLTSGTEPSVEKLPSMPEVPEGSPPGDAEALASMNLQPPS